MIRHVIVVVIDDAATSFGGWRAVAFGWVCT